MASQLGYRPGLDALRAAAALLVLAYHGTILVRGDAGPVPALGVVGVGLFFTLSGFLITSLLLDEQDRAGRIDLLRFYRRRGRRLIPGALAVVVACLLVGLVVPEFVTPGSAAATLGYVQNWFSAAGGDGGALAHTWSLAIEEQFYLLWPLLLIALLRFGRGVVLAVAGLGAAASALLRESLWGEVSAWRIYVGFDTRADGLLIGCALAVAVRTGYCRSRRAAALTGAAVLIATVPLTQHAYHVVAPLTTSLGAVLLILGLLHGEMRIPSWLAWTARRSYGIYLWHVPVMLLLVRSHLHPAVSLGLYVVLSLGLAAGSWVWIERPFLRTRAHLPDDGVAGTGGGGGPGPGLGEGAGRWGAH